MSALDKEIALWGTFWFIVHLGTW